ncbi:MAG: hypothetical protein QXW47_08185 [Candidatus Jordarchaeales archaeon]|nr:hypothetical protein [Candidatus Jordarchaeia archaeon]
MLTLNETDRLLEELRESIATLTPSVCYSCARCSSGCVMVEAGCIPHSIIQLFRLGLLKETEKGLWPCCQCLKCDARCPQDARPAMLILALRNLLVARGHAPPKGYIVMLENIVRHATIQPPQEVMNKDFDFVSRATLGLPELGKPTNMDAFRRNLRKIASNLLEAEEK